MAEAEGSSYSKCRKETQEKPNAADSLPYAAEKAALAQEARQAATAALTNKDALLNTHTLTWEKEETAREATAALTYTTLNKEKLNKHNVNKHRPNKHELNKHNLKEKEKTTQACSGWGSTRTHMPRDAFTWSH